MKAKEYAEKYRSDLDGGEKAALTNLLIGLMKEVVVLFEKRGGSFYAAWKEADNKWRSIAYNNPDLHLKPSGFKDYCVSHGIMPSKDE